MCVDVWIFQGAQRVTRCETQGELAKALLCELPLLPSYAPGARDNRICLCPIDMEVLARSFAAELDPPSYDEDSDHFDAWALRLDALPGEKEGG